MKERIDRQYYMGYLSGAADGLSQSRQDTITELEKIKAKLNNKSFSYSLTENFENDIVIGVITVSDMEKIIDKRIAELKGEK